MEAMLADMATHSSDYHTLARGRGARQNRGKNIGEGRGEFGISARDLREERGFVLDGRGFREAQVFSIKMTCGRIRAYC